MKKLLTLLLLFICIETIAQTPPPIRKKGLTENEKAMEATYKRQGFFRPNTVLEKNKRYYSEDNRYFLLFQEDGNLVVYKVMGNNKVKAIWNTHTNGKAIKKCVFQDDGNLVLYDYNNKAIWAAFTTQYKYLYKKETLKIVMAMQSDGNLVIFDTYFTGNGIGWDSGTGEKN